MKTTEFNREYEKYGISLKFMGTKWDCGDFIKWWVLSYTDEYGTLRHEEAYSINHAEETANHIIEELYVKAYPGGII